MLIRLKLVGDDGLVGSTPTYSTTVLTVTSSIPISRSYADPAPRSPPSAFLSTLYCPVSIIKE